MNPDNTPDQSSPSIPSPATRQPQKRRRLALAGRVMVAVVFGLLVALGLAITRSAAGWARGFAVFLPPLPYVPPVVGIGLLAAALVMLALWFLMRYLISHQPRWLRAQQVQEAMTAHDAEAEVMEVLRLGSEEREAGVLGHVARTAAPPTESISFTAQYPKEIAPQVWAPLLVFAGGEAAGVMEEIHTEAKRELAGWREAHPESEIRATAPVSGSRSVARGESLTVTPQLDGFRINPRSVTVAWEERWQKAAFRIMPETVRPNTSVNGYVSIFIGPLLLAEIPLSIYVHSGEAATPAAATDQRTAAAYRKIFVSYSHRDMNIVLGCTAAAATLGDKFLRDQTDLRSGELWEPRLLELIDEADVFQLFWSANAAESQPTRNEWEHALALRRPSFVRPVFWTDAPFKPLPAPLEPLQFTRLDIQQMDQMVGHAPPLSQTPSSTPAAGAPETGEAAAQNDNLVSGERIYREEQSRTRHDSDLRYALPEARPMAARRLLVSAAIFLVAIALIFVCLVLGIIIVTALAFHIPIALPY